MKTQAFCTLLFSVVAGSGCNGSSDTSALETKVAALDARIATLESQLAAVQPQVTAATTTLDDAAAAISWADDVRQYVTVDSRGDVVVAGANLRVQNVPGETPPAPSTFNGKGNIIVGFDEERREGTCVGGGNDGLACDPDISSECPDGACNNPVVASVKTGSHNVVVGPKHTYTKDNSLLVGAVNAATARGVFIAGVHNSVAGPAGSILGGSGNTVPVTGIESVVCGGNGNSAGGVYAAVLGGQTNSASAMYASVVGGQSNTANGGASVVVGGLSNTTSVAGQYSVLVGGQSNTASTQYAIVP